LYYEYEYFDSYSIKDLIYAIFWGFKFDFATSAIASFLATLFDFHEKIFAIVAAVVLAAVFLIQIGDILYFDESSRHIGYEITDTINDAKSLFLTAYSQHTKITLISLVIVLFLLLFSFKWLHRHDKIEVNRYYFIKKLFLILLTIFFVRGLTQHIPLNPWQSNQIGDNRLAVLSLNSVYNVIYDLANSKKRLKQRKTPFVDDITIKRSFSKIYSNNNKIPTQPMFKDKPNIVFLFLESWSAVNIKSYGYDKSTTPFFDQLLKNSIRPKAMIAGGHRTTEGMFCALASFQNPLGKSVAKTNLQYFEYNTIIKILTKKANYSSAFFQGSSKETSGTGSFAQTLGFQDSYGKRDIEKRVYEENYWGVHDVDLYDFTIKKVENMKKPFVIGINGATTHDDKIPNSIKMIHFTDNEKRNRQLNALHFSDEALKGFVSQIKMRYPNTLFILFADHCGGIKGSNFENYLIPFAIYHKDLEPKYYNSYISQRDIAPTIYNMIFGDYKKDNISFSGKSLISDKDLFCDYFHNGILGWIENDHILELNIASNTHNCYQIIDFKDKKIPCTNEILDFKEKLLSFTQVSQSLLFKGETDKYREYRFKIQP
jgi:phosphoglycerol transferase MdoB-like AlkP superfamily enzyme